MRNYKQFVVVFAVLAASMCDVQSEEIDIDEDTSDTISCPAGHAIDIESSKWNMKYFGNFIPKSWRNLPVIYNAAFLFGTCSYDVTQKIKDQCFGSFECTLSPTKANLDGCSYNMYLRVNYFCRRLGLAGRKRRGAELQYSSLKKPL